LVFSRQFTAFDRQNVDSADSPFHGFFTLFWLGTAIYMIKLAAENWRQHGNILGSNEIMGLMFHRDVMVLGLSDGVMCGVTGFGLILQKLIFKGLLSWDREGWIIQSVRIQFQTSYPLSNEVFDRCGRYFTLLLFSVSSKLPRQL
jgi:sterol O-acyltransferase